MRTIPAAVDAAAVRFGAADAVVEDNRTLSFVELAEAADDVAASLIACGVHSGDRVAIWAPNRADWVVAALGVYAAAAVLVPINTRLKAPEARHILQRSGPKKIILQPTLLDIDLLGLLADVGPLEAVDEVITLGVDGDGSTTGWAAFLERGRAVDHAEIAARKAALRPDDVCDIVFTSGTTGVPKGAMLRHEASIRAYRAWTDHLGLEEGDRFLVIFPYFQTSGLKAGILACVLRGVANIPQAVFDVDDVIRRVAQHRVTVIPGPPTAFVMLLQAVAHDRSPLATLRLAVTGGATTPVALVERMRSELGLDGVVTAYGLTETTGLVSMCRAGDNAELIATSVGRPVPGVEVRAVDLEGDDVAAGSPGELWVRGYNVMAGYLDDPSATAESIDPDGWLHTGDVGTIDADGVVRITDRLKDMFIVGGFNVYPAEVEAALLQHGSIVQVAVVGVPDERLGEVGAAFVVVAAGDRPKPEGLRRWCRDQMASYKVPRQFHFVDELPLNPNGKVLKSILRRRALGEA